MQLGGYAQILYTKWRSGKETFLNDDDADDKEEYELTSKMAFV